MLKEVLRIISIWIIVLPLFAGFINCKGLNKDSKWIFMLVIAALVPQILTFIINKQTLMLNMSYNVYTLIEFFILFFLLRNKYYTLFSKSVLYVTSIMYAVISVILVVRDGIAQRFMNDLVCVNNVVYMIWILLFLKEQYNAEITLIQRRNPFAWYLLALLIYAPCTVFSFALYHYIRELDNPFLLNLWIIQSICNIMLYVLFSVGLFIPRQKDNFK